MAMILDAFVGIFVEKMKELAIEKTVMMLGIEDDFNRLQRVMLGIKRFLEAAERRRLEEPILDQMLAELKNVAYDANDLIDECTGQGDSLLAELPPSPSSSWRRLVSENFTLFSVISRFLSYDDLSSPVKQCFLYCSLFPEDTTLERITLIRLWVAEGFVKEQGYCFMEETAEGYYNELLKRNLLQPDPWTSDNSRCIMHDVMRALAMFLSKDETLTPYTPISPTKLRRFAVEDWETFSNLADLLVEQKCLRTLLLFNDLRWSSIVGQKKLAEPTPLFEDYNQLTVLRCLRVLQIRRMDSIKAFSSIGVLTNLRYLSLDHTGMRELPESIGRLTNLQFLNICACCCLTKLPNSIMQLHNLRCLDLKDTAISFIPKGIEKLGKLNNLSGFIVADTEEQQEGSYSSLKDLGSLHQLRMLTVFRMERAQKGDVSLANLTHLIELKLFYDSSCLLSLECTGVEDVLDELCPPPCLKLLSITFYCGRRYPKWMQSPSFGACFPSLTTLSLVNNKSLTHLPPAGELPQLKTLHIEHTPSVRRIGPEFLGMGAFPKLEFLHIRDLHSLEDWTFGETGETQAHSNLVLLPRLVKLMLFNCSNLKALPKGLGRSAMKELYIGVASSLQAVSNLPNLRKLKLTYSNRLETISFLPALQVLDVNYCVNIQLVEKVDALQRLTIRDHYIEELPQWLAKLLRERKPSERDEFHLEINVNEKVLWRCLKGGPDWSVVERSPSFIAYAKDPESGIRWFIRYTRTPFSYETNFRP